MTNRNSRPSLRTHAIPACAVAIALVLAGCARDASDAEPEPEETSATTENAEDVPVTEATNSIFDQDAEVEPAAEILQPFTATIGFAKNGAGISSEGLAAIETAQASDQFAQGGSITLRGHSDSGGSERVNLRMSRERAEAVRDVLLEAGVSPARIAIIAFGEQNPIEPNALPDGTPNASGRAANRRVELTVGVANPPTDTASPANAAAKPTGEKTTAPQ